MMTKCGAAVNDIAANSLTFFMGWYYESSTRRSSRIQSRKQLRRDTQTFQVAEHRERKPSR
ncbi:MAG: hypothetical protein JWN92_112, partial [Candidatus Acidoferrum typicum]|nr:hypothetical protein [Candidatus Acidoferrum typicum]